MAYAPQRSMNGNLTEGMTDGTYIKKDQDRGGFVEDTTRQAREDLFPVFYNFNESYYKTQPDGTQRVDEGTIRYRSPIRHQG